MGDLQSVYTLVVSSTMHVEAARGGREVVKAEGYIKEES